MTTPYTIGKQQVMSDWIMYRQMDGEAADAIYDETIGDIHNYLEKDVKSRFYIPGVGTLYSEILPGDPPKVRYKLSSKPHKFQC